MSTNDLENLSKEVSNLEKNKINGILVEAGCALGGSAIMMALSKSASRPFKIYDVFGMIPAPGDNDDADVHERYSVIKSGKSKGLNGEEYYGYRDNLLGEVKGNFERYNLHPTKNNINFIPGLFQDTIPVNQDAVALAHIDGDWYESVMCCIKAIAPKLSVGGRFIFDDYETWSGCTKAVDEYFSDKHQEFEFIKKGRLNVIKTK